MKKWIINGTVGESLMVNGSEGWGCMGCLILIIKRKKTSHSFLHYIAEK